MMRWRRSYFVWLEQGSMLSPQITGKERGDVLLIDERFVWGFKTPAVSALWGYSQKAVSG